ncbi:hypothetical protein RB195_004575 [Necator americanus]|uniref:Uncharacterized protein n=1 Tax=Necator americanus TaxID=51031 RepID=A0ABR1BIN8_NECAM
MGTPKSHRKTAGVGLRILFDSIENGGVFDRVGASRPVFFFEVGVSAWEASEPATVLMVAASSSNLLLMLRVAVVAPMPPRHSWKMIALA